MSHLRTIILHTAPKATCLCTGGGLPMGTGGNQEFRAVGAIAISLLLDSLLPKTGGSLFIQCLYPTLERGAEAS